MFSTKLVFFRADRKNKIAAPASDWLRHFRLLWNRWTEFKETWEEARSQRLLQSLCFSGRSEKQDGRPGLWLAETFSTSPLKPLIEIQGNLTWSKISTSYTKFVFFVPIGKMGWPPRPLIDWDIFDFSSETADRNSRKLDTKQDRNVLYQVCVFRADRKKTRWLPSPLIVWIILSSTEPKAEVSYCYSDSAPSIVRSVRPSVVRKLSHFRLLLWNRWTEFNETWQEARSTPSTKFVFFGPIIKTRWPPWPLIGWDIFDFSSETDAQNSKKLDRMQDLNVLYQVCVFRADRKNKMAALASDRLRHFRLLLWNRWTVSDDTWQEARSQRPLPSFFFFGPIEKKTNRRPGLWLAETFPTSPLKPLNGIQRNLTGSKISKSSTKFVFFGLIGKTRWPPRPLIGWDIFDFFSETADWNSTKLDRKEDLNILYQVCVFQADRKNKMTALASDWLRHFRLLLWNRWTEFNETWQEARFQCSLPSLCFFGPIGKTRLPPRPLIGWDIFDFSSETTDRNSRKLDMKQDLNVFYKVCVFRADRKNGMAALASDCLNHFKLNWAEGWSELLL